MSPRVPKGLVGITRQIAHVESLLCMGSDDVRIIGIWGMGGIGKTTIADALYAKLSSQFEGSYFVANVREEWENRRENELRNKVLAGLLGDQNLCISTPTMSSTFVVERLQRKKLLIVLDDVSDSKQIEYLVGEKDWFGPGSRIIVTTRNKDVFSRGVDGVYPVMELNFHEAMELFSLNAFQQDHPMREYQHLSERAVDYAKGNPLALKVLGSHLYAKRPKDWESALEKLKKIPKAEIYEVLRLSYEGLDLEEQNIFLDIACCLKGETKSRIASILDGCGFSADIGMRSLEDKSLITVSKGNDVQMHDLIQDMHRQISLTSILDGCVFSTDIGMRSLENMSQKTCLEDMSLIAVSKGNEVQMHDLIQEMGLQIVRKESMKEPGKRSRLWDPKEIYDVLKYNKGTDSIESIALDTSQIDEVTLSPQTFHRMNKLRLLNFYMPSCDKRRSNVQISRGLECMPSELSYLRWDCFPLNSLPPSLCAAKLVELDLRHSLIEKLWDGVQDLVNLKSLNLCGCEHLSELPDFFMTTLLSKLNKLSLRGSNIENLPGSIQHLSQLRALDVSNCPRLCSLPELPFLLQDLNASNCISLETVSNLGIAMLQDSFDRLKKRSLVRQIQKEEKMSIRHCGYLGRFDFYNCIKLDQIACNTIMEVALIRIQLAAYLSSTIEECHDPYCQTNDDPQDFVYISRPVYVTLPGSEVPNWFVHKRTDHRNIIRLTPWEPRIGTCVPIRGTFTNWFSQIPHLIRIRGEPVADLHVVGACRQEEEEAAEQSKRAISGLVHFGFLRNFNTH